MSDSLTNEQRELLLTAYFDDELGPEERAQAELILAERPEEARKLAKWRQNADAIRELPRFRLDDGFAARVMIAVESNAEQLNTESMLDKVQLPQVGSQRSDWRIGLAAIMTLAAMLLLTLFVFPAMNDSKFDNPSVAVNQTESNVIENNQNSDIETAQVPPNDQESFSAPSNRRPRIGTLNSSLPSERRNSRSVEPIAVVNPAQTPNIEQVLWVETKSLDDLENILANHSIHIVSADKHSREPAHLAAQSAGGPEALFVVSTALQMKQAIVEMSNDSTCSVRAFPLPDVGTVAPENSLVVNASAQQIKPLDLNEKGADASEIARLDKWFGLVDDTNEERMIQFLLMVNTESRSTVDSSQD